MIAFQLCGQCVQFTRVKRNKKNQSSARSKWKDLTDGAGCAYVEVPQSQYFVIGSKLQKTYFWSRDWGNLDSLSAALYKSCRDLINTHLTLAQLDGTASYQRVQQVWFKLEKPLGSIADKQVHTQNPPQNPLYGKNKKVTHKVSWTFLQSYQNVTTELRDIDVLTKVSPGGDLVAINVVYNLDALQNFK